MTIQLKVVGNALSHVMLKLFLLTTKKHKRRLPHGMMAPPYEELDQATVFTRDAMHARYMLWPCVCPSVCHKSVFY